MAIALNQHHNHSQVETTRISTNTSEKSKLVWITGASSGIGFELALEYARQGHTVVATARSEEKLLKLVKESSAYSGKIVSIVADVTSNESVLSAVGTLDTMFNQWPDVVVLNAGYYEPLELDALDLDHFEHTFNVNFRGVVRCLVALLPQFRQRQSGHFVIVSSVAGYRGLPRAAAYGSSKAALIHLAESLRVECNAENIQISVVNPGFVRTPLTDLNSFRMPFIIDADTAAKRMFNGIEANQFEITFPRRFTWMFKATRLLPYSLYFAVTRRLL